MPETAGCVNTLKFAPGKINSKASSNGPVLRPGRLIGRAAVRAWRGARALTDGDLAVFQAEDLVG
jgi:hypothetical protein